MSETEKQLLESYQEACTIAREINRDLIVYWDRRSWHKRTGWVFAAPRINDYRVRLAYIPADREPEIEDNLPHDLEWVRDFIEAETAKGERNV